MSEQVMSIDSERVSGAINRISVLVADLETRTKKFVDLVNEKNKNTEGKFKLIATLEEKLNQEIQNIADISEAQKDVEASLRRYTELADEANDDSELR